MGTPKNVRELNIHKTFEEQMSKPTKKQIDRIIDRLNKNDVSYVVAGDIELVGRTKYSIDPQDYHESRATIGKGHFRARTPMEALLKYILANRTIEGCQKLEIKRVRTSAHDYTHEVREYPEDGSPRFHHYIVEIKGVV